MREEQRHHVLERVDLADPLLGRHLVEHRDARTHLFESFADPGELDLLDLGPGELELLVEREVKQRGRLRAKGRHQFRHVLLHRVSNREVRVNF